MLFLDMFEEKIQSVQSTRIVAEKEVSFFMEFIFFKDYKQIMLKKK